MKYTKSIKNSGTFKYCINKGKFSSGRYLVVYLTKVKKNANFLGICVSKKNGNSVNRNKMKRWVREVYTKIEKDILVGLNIIVLFKKSTKIQDLDYIKVKEDVEMCFEKLEIFGTKND